MLSPSPQQPSPAPSPSQRSISPPLPSLHPEYPLDPQSYTAHRLHHATPQHLHITSRRVFIGPIPVGWLQRHRSDWYKHHLHVHYSSRAATFSADEQTGRRRALSDLDRRKDRQGRSNSWVQRNQSPPRPPSPVTIPKAEPRARATSSGARIVMEKGAEETGESSRARSRPPTARSASYKPEYITRANRGDSFSTAHESWETADDQRPHSSGGAQGLPMTPEEERRFMDIAAATSSRPQTKSSDGMASSISVPPSTEAANSLTLLLRKDQLGRTISEPEPEILQRQETWDDMDGPIRRPSLLRRFSRPLQRRDEDEEEDERPQPERQVPKVSTNKDKVSGGLVRFNTAVEDHERDRRLQQKLADLSRSRSLRLGGRRHPHIRKREGEIIKYDSMLICIETAHGQQLPSDYDENESVKIATRTADKWREYVVVCRENGPDDDVPMNLRLYKSRIIPAIDRRHVSARSTEIPLNAKTTKVNLYSSLDKSLVIWLPHKRGTMIYILRPRCASSSVEWYTFLRGVLGEPRLETLHIAVPDLSLTVKIQNPFGSLEERLNAIVDAGDTASDAPAAAEKQVAENILRKSVQMLEGITEWDSIINHWLKDERLGLAWRRYDRLEWIHGMIEQNMFGTTSMLRTHELELRPKTHYPTETILETGDKMEEPPPIEGFLIRLTSAKGREQRLGRLFSKRLYFSTHDSFLCFCNVNKAMPPSPPKLRGSSDANLPSAQQIVDEIPLIYNVVPYALNATGQIDWLKEIQPQERIDQKDREAYDEAERKTNMLLNAAGFVDLVKVAEINICEADGPSPQGGDISHKCFEIVLDNALSLRLQAFDQETRDEWVKRLRHLVTYWKARDRADLAIVRQTREENLQQLNVDEEVESLIGQFARKWEVSRSVASGELYHVCGISSCRSITLSGVLYRKPRKHSTFRRYNVILCHGTLLTFTNMQRTATGTELPTVYQERHNALSLRDCYVYSGLITESELLYQNQTFDSNSPGRHPMPRIYPDGYTSHDEDTMTCFVLWHGARRQNFKNTDSAGNTTRQKVTAMGVGGQKVVFKARSRMERDMWVMGIAMEIERLNVGASEEIRVVPPKQRRGLIR